MAYRLGRLSVRDPWAGALAIEGDGFAAAGELVTLLVNQDVQRYLEMTPEQVRQAAEIAARYRQALTDIYQGRPWKPPHVDPAAAAARAELNASVDALLGPRHAARLRRLSWRIRNADALVDTDVADALKLTPDQREAIARIAEANEEDHRRVLGQVRNARLRDHAALEDAGARANDDGHERLLGLLTPEQRATFEQLKRENP